MNNEVDFLGKFPILKVRTESNQLIGAFHSTIEDVFLHYHHDAERPHQLYRCVEECALCVIKNAKKLFGLLPVLDLEKKEMAVLAFGATKGNHSRTLVDIVSAHQLSQEEMTFLILTRIDTYSYKITPLLRGIVNDESSLRLRTFKGFENHREHLEKSFPSMTLAEAKRFDSMRDKLYMMGLD